MSASLQTRLRVGQASRTVAKQRIMPLSYTRYHQQVGAHMVSGATPATMLEGSCFVNFPIILPQQRRDEIARALMLSGFDVGRSLYPNAHRHSRFSNCEGQSDNVDRLVASTIYLPTHFGVSTDYAASLTRRLSEELT